MSVNSRLSERCDSDRGISKKVSTQERKIRERVFELHAIKLSIPSCLNLLERLVLGTSAHSPRGGGGGGHASIQMCFRSPSLLFSLKPCSTSSRILFNALLSPCFADLFTRALMSNTEIGYESDFNYSLSLYRFVLMGILKCYF